MNYLDLCQPNVEPCEKKLVKVFAAFIASVSKKYLIFGTFTEIRDQAPSVIHIGPCFDSFLVVNKEDLWDDGTSSLHSS